MAESKDFLQKAGLISATNLIQDLLDEMDAVKQRYNKIIPLLTASNVLNYEGQIYSFCICSDKTKLNKLHELFDLCRDLLQYEKPSEKLKQKLYAEIKNQINLIWSAFINESYDEIVKTQREVVKHLRLIDTTIADSKSKKDEKKEGQNEQKKT